ncbi:MAG: hypothetical protein A2020_03635 [Lentisphaerae bacterium GWF2_45_14]|nr:MAG: hypothetical protein A2020_03635 [Lentisphaerae bacterium GWF2_45_14]
MSRKQKYIDVSERILSFIKKEKLKDGERLPSEKQLASGFGVNHMTVRKALEVLNKEGAISKIPSRGNFVGKSAAPLSKSRLIGVVFPEYNTFFSEILSGLESRMNIFGASPVVHFTRGSAERERRIIENLTEIGVEGLISAPSLSCAGEYRELRVPSVFFDSYIDNMDIPCVVTDDRAGAFAAVEHLILMGHKSIAYVGSRDKTSAIRKTGYLDALSRYSLKMNPAFCLEKEYSRQWGFDAAVSLVSGKEKPTAIFCANDAIAAGVIGYMTSRSLRAPDDCSVVGFGNMGFSEDIGLSTVDQPVSLIVENIWKNMVMLRNGEKVTGKTVIPTTLIVRRTSARPARK